MLVSGDFSVIMLRKHGIDGLLHRPGLHKKEISDQVSHCLINNLYLYLLVIMSL